MPHPRTPDSLPRNIRGISDWIEKNRPDILQQWNVIARESKKGRHPRFQGMLALALMAFDAGRDFERDHGGEGGVWDISHLPKEPSDA